MRKSALEHHQQRWEEATARARRHARGVAPARPPRYSMVLPMLALLGLCGLALILLLVYAAIFR